MIEEQLRRDVNIGGQLRDARERRGLTLSQIADSTKLSIAMLRLIERNEFGRLPGGILVRGYLRAYAVDIGLDPEEVVQAYLRAASAPADGSPVVHHQDADLRAARGLIAPVLGVICGVAVAVGAYSARREPEPPAPPIATVASIPDAVAVAADPSTADGVLGFEPAPAIDGTPATLSLEIVPRGDCWVSVVADGRSVIDRLFKKGDRAVATARHGLIVRVGDPAAFAYRLNGKPGRPLRTTSQPITVEITTENVDLLLASPAANGSSSL